MSKERLLELITEHLTVFTPSGPEGHIEGKEELADAILQAEQEEMQQEFWKPVKYKWVNKPSGNIYLGDPGKEDTEWVEPDAILDELEDNNKPNFSFFTTKPEDWKSSDETEKFEWSVKETSFPLTQEYAYLKSFVDFLEDKCNIEKAGIFLNYYLGYVTTETEEHLTQEEYPDTITAGILQDFEEYVMGMDWMNNKWRRELKAIIMQYLEDRV